MKIFNTKQIYAADQYTLKEQKIKSIDLMERASLALFNWLHLRLGGNPLKINLFCGIGNNGGDGLALARHLWEHGYSIEVYIVNYSDKRSEDFLENLKKLKERKIWPNYIDEASEFPKITPGEIIIDAIFGIGLNRKPDPWLSNLIQSINKSGLYVLSIDIPSGLYMDKHTDHIKSIIKANMVLSFQVPKLIFFLPDTNVYCREWEVLDIGLSPTYLQDTESKVSLIHKVEVLQHYKYREKFAHKGSYGHSLLIGGSYGKIGAVSLASRACIGSGSGLVTTYIPKCGYIPLQVGVPEVMVLTDTEEQEIGKIDFKLTPTVIAIGMGMGTSKKTATAFANFIQHNKEPLVIDADGINLLSENLSLLAHLPPKTVITPHPGELKRLLGSWHNDFEKLEKAKQFSKDTSCILIIKGANTTVVYQDSIYINTSGNPGMATAGSGDVLSGIITSLIAQQYEPLFASKFGVYLHGLSGDIAATQLGLEALTASSIINTLGLAFKELLARPEQPTKEPTKED